MFLYYFCIANLVVSSNFSILASARSWSFSSMTNDLAQKCDWIANKGIPITEINRKRKILETCLFDTLIEKFEQQNKDKIVPFSLKDPPPATWGTSKSVTVLVHNLIMQVFERQNRFSPNNFVEATAFLSWVDGRFQWDPEEWHNVTHMIELPDEMWLPEEEAGGVIVGPNDEIETYSNENIFETTISHVNISHNGNITAAMSFRVQAECVSDEYHYPTETVHCCSGFEARNNIRNYKVASETKKLNGVSRLSIYGTDLSELWTISNVELKYKEEMDYGESTKNSLDPYSNTRLILCFEAEQSLALLKLQINLPALTSGVLFIITPFFRCIATQIYAKMFAILVQILCMQHLFDETASNYLSKTPKIFLFYQRTFVFTLVNFILTLLFVGLHKHLKNVSLKPPEQLLQVTRFLNQFWHFSNNQGENEYDEDVYNYENEVEMVRRSTEQRNKPGNVAGCLNENYARENRIVFEEKKNFASVWKIQILALNDLCSFFLVVFYIITVAFMLIL